MRRSALLAMILAGAIAAQAPEELGLVTWSRNLDDGLAAAKKSGKPVLLLFQEVPG